MVIDRVILTQSTGAWHPCISQGSGHPDDATNASIQGVSLPVLEMRVWYNPPAGFNNLLCVTVAPFPGD